MAVDPLFELTKGAFAFGDNGDIVKMGHIDKGYKPINIVSHQNINQKRAGDFWLAINKVYKEQADESKGDRCNQDHDHTA